MSTAMVSMVLDCFPSGGSMCLLAVAMADAADDEGGNIFKSVATLAHQSKQDNRYGAGNVVEYRINLIARIGLERVEALETDSEPRKWTREDLKVIAAIYRSKLRELKKGVA